MVSEAGLWARRMRREGGARSRAFADVGRCLPNLPLRHSRTASCLPLRAGGCDGRKPLRKAETPVISGSEIQGVVCGPQASSAPWDICACLPKEGQVLSPSTARSIPAVRPDPRLMAKPLLLLRRIDNVNNQAGVRQDIRIENVVGIVFLSAGPLSTLQSRDMFICGFPPG